MSLALHLGLFAALGFAITLLGAFYAEPDDRAALASLPRRLIVFYASCGLLALVMLFCEHTFASAS